MGKRGHGGKKRNKKQKAGNDPQKNDDANNGKIILDKKYNGKLRAITIKNISEDINLKDIAENIKYTDGNHYTLYAIERLNRKKTENGSVLIEPSRTCKLTFKGDMIPSKVILWCIEAKCQPFWNNVIQCYKCLRYRHLSTTCKGYARCSKCGERKENNHKCNTPDKLTCANCTGNHDAMDNICPIFVFNKECNLYMAQENVDYKTAVKLLKGGQEKLTVDQIFKVVNFEELVDKLLNKIQNKLESTIKAL